MGQAARSLRGRQAQELARHHPQPRVQGDGGGHTDRHVHRRVRVGPHRTPGLSPQAERVRLCRVYVQGGCGASREGGEHDRHRGQAGGGGLGAVQDQVRGGAATGGDEGAQGVGWVGRVRV